MVGGSSFPYCRYWVWGLLIFLFFGTDFTDFAVFVSVGGVRLSFQIGTGDSLSIQQVVKAYF
jgi:hypothetical protein